MKKLALALALITALQAQAATLEFGFRDTVTNKEPGTANVALEYTHSDLSSNGVLFTTNDFKGTINTVFVAARATSASSGFSGTSVPQINANVFVKVGTTETEFEVPILVWDNGETSTAKYGNMAIPINLRFIQAENASVAVKFTPDDAGTGFTDFSGVANFSYTVDN